MSVQFSHCAPSAISQKGLTLVPSEHPWILSNEAEAVSTFLTDSNVDNTLCILDFQGCTVIIISKQSATFHSQQYNYFLKMGKY